MTNSLDRLLPTVRSRCQTLGFFPLDEAQMSGWLDANLGEVNGAAREFVQMYAVGSPGAAVTAVELGLQSLHADLLPMIDQLERGDFPLAMSDRMNDFAAEVAEVAVKRNENASKEAANRRATGVMFSVIGAEVVRRMRASTNSSDKLEYWAKVPDLIADAERNLQANVNQNLFLPTLWRSGQVFLESPQENRREGGSGNRTRLVASWIAKSARRSRDLAIGSGVSGL